MPRWLIPIAAAALLLACLAAFASIGAPHDPLTGLSTVLFLLLRAGAPALAYLAAAAGLGRVFLPLIRGSREAGALQLGLGLGLMLWCSHLLGVLGMFRAGLALPVAAGTIGVGVLLLGQQLAGHRGAIRATLSPLWLLGIPAVALLMVGACQPPGWLWDSEAGGYDALSYHLQLPREWLQGGRIWPNTHNVFSFLPSYVEAAFTHLGALGGGLLAGEGLGLISCQFLSVGIALIATGLVSRLGVEACRRAGLESPAAGALAGLLLLCTPWTIVVGSLAYNDPAMVALIAAAMLVALDPALNPARRGLLAGLLVGAACGCKPTALILGAPPVGVALLATTPVRRWAGPILAGSLAGLFAIAPWLIRNYAACGNPVFPEATGLLGRAHWSADQVLRYAHAVSFHGSWADRLRLTILPDPGDPMGARHRGLFHPQWLVYFGAAPVAAAVALLTRKTHRPAAILGAGLGVQLLAWLFLTHIQSRFLLPLAAPGCALFALAAAGTGKDSRARWVGPRTGLAVIVCLVQTTGSVLLFAAQRDGRPNGLLVSGPGVRTGEPFRAELAALPPTQRAQALDGLAPEAFCNLALPPGAGLYLLGDSTPLYYTGPVLYNTTWDSWPLADAMRAAPGEPAAWSNALRARGVRFVLVNPSEIDRLRRSGWADPIITPESVSGWLEHAAHPVKQWPNVGLFDLLPSPPEPVP